MRAKIDTKLLKTITPGDKRFDVYDEDMPGFILRVEPSGIMTYYLRYRMGSGQQVMEKIGAASNISLPEARKAAKRIMATVTQGGDPREERRKGRCATLRQFLDSTYGPWLIENRKAGSAMLGRLRTGCASLLDKKLVDINPWAVEQWRRPYIARGSIVSANRHLAYLKSALGRAVEWRLIKINAVAGVKRLKEDHPRQGQIRVLTAEEEVKLWAAVNAREERIRTGRDSGNTWRAERGREAMPDLRQMSYVDFVKPFLTLALHTGLRRGELFAAEWRDIDLEKSELTVRAESAKSGKTRRIPLNQTAIECLTKWRAQSTGEGLLFPSPQTGDKLTSVKTVWTTLINEAKITGLTLHCLRHTFCSRLLQGGTDIQTVRELAGHGNIAVTSVYLHSDPSAKIAAVARLTNNVIPFKKPRKKAATGREG